MEDFLNLIQQLTLENPWPVGGTLVLAGVVLWMGALHRGNRKQGMVALSLWVLAAGVFILSASVTTTREVVRKQTQTLLRSATAPVDIDYIRQAMRDDARLVGPEGSVWLEYQELMPEVDKALKRWPVRQMAIREMDINVRGDIAQVLVRISSRTSDDNFPNTPTLWRLQWRQEGKNQWKLETIQWLEWMGQPPPRNIWK